MSQSHDQLETIFDAARQLSGEERQAYLARACGADAAFRQKVERLLRALERAGGFLARTNGPEAQSSPIAAAPLVVPPSGGAGANLPAALDLKPGDQIGRYKLLEKIGEGGFGVVYMAEQREPVKRKVALKIIKVGMDTKEVVARFEAERQALALMDHPNIAKILDGGATGQPRPSDGRGAGGEGSSESQISNLKSQIPPGRPYFVMELVRGIRITDFCDQNQLGLPERLALFLQVCHAVQHAHQKGIIHRDLKPSNILVTVNDGVPVPKVIDFGIAKATQQELTEKTLFTAYGQFMGTPAYMSPEQAVMTSLDIDTRSDIYSLGVLLYELLTGATPFDTRELLKVGLDELCRTLREVEPPRPSTRLTQDLVAADVSRRTSKPGPRDSESGEISADSRRRLQTQKLIHLIRGDLDWIVMKCLEKDRTRRYETASALAADLQRHLNNEPVTARPPSTAYRLQKLVRRHKLVFAAAASVALVTVAGAALNTWQLLEKNRALQQRVRMSQFLKEVFRGLAQHGDPKNRTTQLHILNAAARHLDSDLKDPPELQADVRVALGAMYYSFGDFSNAVAIYRPALDIYRAVHGSNHEEVASMLNSLGVTFQKGGDRERAEPLLRESLDLWRRLLGPDDTKLDTPRENLAFLARRLAQSGRADCWPLTESLYREAWDVTQHRNGSNDWFAATKLAPLVQVLHEQKKFAEAAPYARRAVTILETVRSNDWRTFQAQSVLGANLSAQTNYAAAEQYLLKGHRGLLLNSTNNAQALLLIMESAERLAAHYAAAGPPEQADRWQREAESWSKRYGAFNNAAARKQPPTTAKKEE